MQNFHEAIIENLSVLDDCTKATIDLLPYALNENQIHTVSGSRIYQTLIGKYKGTRYEPVIEVLKNTEFIFSNSTMNMKRRLINDKGEIITVPNGTMGYYRVQKGMRYGTVGFNISAMMKSAEKHTKSDILSFRNTDLPLKSFKAVVVHELRHVFQSVLYANYYFSVRDDTYTDDPVEVDAAFMHHLVDYPPSEYSNVSAYVDAVMKSFAEYKKIKPDHKRYMHYYRKAASYYFEKTRSLAPDLLNQTRHQRLNAARKFITDPLIAAFEPYTKRDFDLRQIRGYDQNSRNFLLSSRVFAVASGLMSKNAKTIATNAPFIYLAAALFVRPGMETRTQKYLERVTKLPFENALDMSVFNGFDTSTIRNLIENKFG